MTQRNTWQGFMQSCTPKGFTLIELLVVVLIIGILAAIAVPQYKKAVEKSKMAEALTYVNAMEKNIENYILEHGFITGPSSHAYSNDEFIIELPLNEMVRCERQATLSSPTYCNKYFVISPLFQTHNKYQFEIARTNVDTTIPNGADYPKLYRIKLEYTPTGKTKTYTQTANAKVNLKPDFEALGYTVN